MKRILFPVICLICFTFSACKKYDYKKFAGAEFSPSIALPVINTSVGIEDLINQAEETGYIKVGPDNLISIIYSSQLASLQASELIDIPDQDYLVAYFLSPGEIAALTANGTTSFTRTQTINFDTGGDPVADSVVYKNGDLHYTFTSELEHDLELIVKIPAARKNGLPFTETVTLDYQGSTPVTFNKKFDLTGYRFDFTQTGQDNEFDIDYTVTVTNSGQPVNGTDDITLELSFLNNEFSHFYGYVGQTDITNSLDSIDLGIFDKSIGNGTFSLESPIIEILFKNAYGIPIEATFPKLEVWDSDQGTIPISGSGVPTKLMINAPTLSQIGQHVTSSLLLDKTNSNIAQILNATPELLIYQIQAETNPNGKTSNFVLDTSKLDIILNLELPLHGTMKDFVLQDTLGFEIVQIDQLNEVLFRANFNNGFPFDVAAQVYFADENYIKIDSLFDGEEPILLSAPVDANGKVSASTEKTTDIILDQSKLNKLGALKYLILKVRASTTDDGNTPVKIYADYKIDFKLGIKADADVSLQNPLN